MEIYRNLKKFRCHIYESYINYLRDKKIVINPPIFIRYLPQNSYVMLLCYVVRFVVGKGRESLKEGSSLPPTNKKNTRCPQ